MYSYIKTCIRANGKVSDFFSSNTGVQQSENLSIYCSRYILTTYMIILKIDKSVVFHSKLYVKLFLLMYAYDTVIFCELSGDLQKALDVYHEYCIIWRLTVNTAKTKILVFSHKKVKTSTLLITILF